MPYRNVFEDEWCCVLAVAGGQIAETTTFDQARSPALGLPLALLAGTR